MAVRSGFNNTIQDSSDPGSKRASLVVQSLKWIFWILVAVRFSSWY